MHLEQLRLLDVDTPLASGRTFLSAASGLVVSNNRLYMVADDDHFLFEFSVDPACPGKLIRLFSGDLPRGAKERKAKKADFEILLPLYGEHRLRLLAMGSGSTERRMRGAVVDFPADDGPPNVEVVDLTPMYEKIAHLVEEINLEGACLQGSRMLLFNRGNMQSTVSHILEIGWDGMDFAPDSPVRIIAELALPMIGNVPLTVTDACSLDDGTILISSVAEATDNSYADGALVGAAFILLDASFGIMDVEHINPPVKIEGVSAKHTSEGIALLCVSDADDPDQPSALFSGLIILD